MTDEQALEVLRWVFRMAAIAKYDGDDVEEAAIKEAGQDLGRTGKIPPSQEVGGRYDEGVDDSG